MARLIFAVFLGLSLAASSVSADDAVVVGTRTLSAPQAMQLATIAYEDCAARGYRVSVAVVARDGSLVAFLRHPDSGPHSIEVAQRKAWTANTFRTATTVLQAGTRSDFMRDIPGALIIGGGLPLNMGGYHLGAVGVSGAPAEKVTGDLDDACAQAGIDAIRTDVEMGL